MPQHSPGHNTQQRTLGTPCCRGTALSLSLSLKHGLECINFLLHSTSPFVRYPTHLHPNFFLSLSVWTIIFRLSLKSTFWSLSYKTFLCLSLCPPNPLVLSLCLCLCLIFSPEGSTCVSSSKQRDLFPRGWEISLSCPHPSSSSPYLSQPYPRKYPSPQLSTPPIPSSELGHLGTRMWVHTHSDTHTYTHTPTSSKSLKSINPKLLKTLLSSASGPEWSNLNFVVKQLVSPGPNWWYDCPE